MVRIPPPDSNLVERREILDQAGIARALRRMAYEMIERNAADNQRPLYLVGVRTGGAFLAQRLCALMSDPKESHAGPPPLLGAVDITLYRDDVFHGLPKPEIGPTDLPFAIEGQTIILVDDVLYTGRTVRAAMDAINSFGRPARIQLAVLVDRGHRELPIRPDYIGKNLPTATREQIQVRLQETDNEPDGVWLEKE
jgi:pyrimidine operon attenuation protein / uracil phosphoribosyltransferase